MSYKPLPDNTTIKKSNINGLGLFAKKNIDKDVNLGITHHYINIKFKDELIRTPLSGFINHSIKPNAYLEEYENGKGVDYDYKSYKLITSKQIQKGSEILLDYTKELCGLSTYKDEEWLKENYITFVDPNYIDELGKDFSEFNIWLKSDKYIPGDLITIKDLLTESKSSGEYPLLFVVQYLPTKTDDGYIYRVMIATDNSKVYISKDWFICGKEVIKIGSSYSESSNIYG